MNESSWTGGVGRMGSDGGPRAASTRRGLAMVIVAVWTGWAVAVLVAPILKQAEAEGIEGSDGLGPAALLQRGNLRQGAGGPLVRLPVHLPRRRKAGTGPEKLAKIVQTLADMYAMHCGCARKEDCPCAQDAEERVKQALDNAVDREFAPPNMYYRSRNGYDIRVRGFQHAKTHMNGKLTHDKFLDIKPIRAAWRQHAVREQASTPTTEAKKRGLPPIDVQGRFVNEDMPKADAYLQSHVSAADSPTETAMRRQQTTNLWEFNYVPLADEEFPGKHPTLMEARAAKDDYLEALAAACEQDPALEACKELQEEEGEEDGDEGAEPYEDSWFDDFVDYAKLVLQDGELEEAKAKAASGVPPAPDAAFAIPYQVVVF